MSSVTHASRAEATSVVRAARKRLGWRQPEMAQACGVVSRTVGRWETGETPTPVIVVVICELVLEDNQPVLHKLLARVRSGA